MTPKFIRTTIPEREALGEKLAKKRAALGYDIKEVERATRIRAKHVEYLEAGEWEKLPPDVYVRGFLKNYATFLKLDPVKVTRVYLKERGLKENVKKISVSNTAPPVRVSKIKTPRIIITPKRIAITSAILGALAIVGYIGWQISILAAPPKLEIKTPSDNTKVEEQQLVVEGKTDAGADVSINDVPIGLDPDGNFKEKISLQDGVNLIKVSAKNKLGKSTVSTRTILAKLKTISTNDTPKTENLEMKLDVGPNSASIYIEVDGKPISDKNAVMLPGSSQKITAKEKIVITASDGGSVRVTLNGKDLGLLGKSGEKIKEKEFNKSSI
jgi:cytoskeletal protein RodZ